MSRDHTFESLGGGCTFLPKYTRDELRAGWADYHGQGNTRARERDPNTCVLVLDLDEEQALQLTALLCRRCFNLRSCAHYNPNDLVLSFYLGDGGDPTRAMARARRIISGFLAVGVDEYGVLFADQGEGL